MTTPVGHAIAGLATGWFSDALVRLRHTTPGRAAARLTMACVAAAMAPDLDILFRMHRSYTHSVGAAMIAGAVAWLVARRKSSALGSPSVAGLTVAVAYSTHVLLDWLAKDTAPPFGLMALWPFSSRFYLSGANIFLEVSRRYWKPEEFIVGNFKAVGWEVITLAPVAVLAWWVRERVNSRRSKVERHDDYRPLTIDY